MSIVLSDASNDALADCVRRARLANQSTLKLIDPAYRRRPRTKPIVSTRKARTTQQLVEGDPCPKCQTSVTRQPVKGQARKPGQQYFWAWLLRCDGCGARFQTREGRRRIEPTALTPATT